MSVGSLRPSRDSSVGKWQSGRAAESSGKVVCGTSLLLKSSGRFK